MPRLPKPTAVQLTLDFDKPLPTESHLDIWQRIYAMQVPEWALMLRRQANPCRCPSCGGEPVSLSMDNNLRSDRERFLDGTRYFLCGDRQDRVELTCRCGQHWLL